MDEQFLSPEESEKLIGKYFKRRELPPFLWHAFTREFKQFPIPTEMIICEVGVATPKFGRAFETDFRVHRSGGDEGCKWSASVSLWLEEVYYDNGDDGHTDFDVVGYRIKTRDESIGFTKDKWGTYSMLKEDERPW